MLWPLSSPVAAARLGMGGTRGVLLYGPPGTGKTLLVRALAAKAGLNLVAVAIPQLIVPEVGGSERAIADLFVRARTHAPCLLLLDEMQALFGRRGEDGDAAGAGAGNSDETAADIHGGGLGTTGRQMLSQLLLEMDALHAPRRAEAMGADRASVGHAHAPSEGALVIIGITNTPWAIDPSLLRPGRLEHSLFMPPPARAGRAAILRDRLRRMPIARPSAPLPAAEPADDNGHIDGMAAQPRPQPQPRPHPHPKADPNGHLNDMAARLANSTPGFSGADLHNLCQRAALVALQRLGVGGGLIDTGPPDACGGVHAGAVDPGHLLVSGADFEEALTELQPSVTAEMIARLKRWSASRGS